MVDFERLDNAITYAVAHPDEFDMDMWFRTAAACGTTACLAGTVALHAGWKPIQWEKWGSGLAASKAEKDGVRKPVSLVAGELLGLDFDQPDAGQPSDFELFYANDIAGVIKVRNRLARDANVPERTWDLPAVTR